LGAHHDGDEENDNCSSRNEYIMSKQNPIFTRYKRYTDKPWLFAQCSVSSFKGTLPY
ncbi:hypothetical protein ACJMK2_007659, partial [Sinanodonta woodiana]